jgi:peroxiredoxin
MKEAFAGRVFKSSLLMLCFVFLTAMGPNASAITEKMKAPEFSLKDLRGKSVSLASLKGKVIILNFWATWCPSCIAEMPSLNKLYNEMKSRGLEVIAVSSDRSADDVNEYMNKKGFGFQILIDESRSAARLYKVFSLPMTFLIDRNGFIVDKFFGAYDWEDTDIKKKIEKFL